MALAEIPKKRETERNQRPDIAFGVYIPNKVITNLEIEAWRVETFGGHILTAADILKRTGIKQRHRVDHFQSAFTMGHAAINGALKEDPNPAQIDAVIASTSYPTGLNLSREYGIGLGIKVNNLSLDVYAACSGFVRGLSFIKEREDSYKGKKILLVATENYSPTLENIDQHGPEKDPSLSQTIFSDGAAAIIFTYGENLRILGNPVNKRFPQDNQYIRMPIRKDLIIKGQPFIEEPVPNTDEQGKPVRYFYQDGKNVYRAIKNKIPPLIREAVENAGLKAEDISLVIPHQPSIHALDTLRDQLPEYEIFYDIEDGNFSSASIPLALKKAVENGRVKRKDKVVLAGFGAGLFASIAVVEFL